LDERDQESDRQKDRGEVHRRDGGLLHQVSHFHENFRATSSGSKRPKNHSLCCQVCDNA
jgi:hypothetical protein